MVSDTNFYVSESNGDFFEGFARPEGGGRRRDSRDSENRISTGRIGVESGP